MPDRITVLITEDMALNLKNFEGLSNYKKWQ